MHEFLETYYLSKLNQEEAENLNRLRTTSKIEAIVRKLWHKKPWIRWIPRWILPDIQEKLTSILLKLFQKNQEEGRLPNSFYKISISLIPKPGEGTIKKDNYKPISLMNIDAKILNKILSNLFIFKMMTAKIQNHTANKCFSQGLSESQILHAMCFSFVNGHKLKFSWWHFS